MTYFRFRDKFKSTDAQFLPSELFPYYQNGIKSLYLTFSASILTAALYFLDLYRGHLEENILR